MSAPVESPVPAAPEAAPPPRPVALFLQLSGRTLGPLTRDELAGYFSAGLVDANATVVGPEWDGAFSAAAAAEWLGLPLRSPVPAPLAAVGTRDPATLPPLPPAPLAYRRAGPGWRVVALWLVVLLAVQMAIVPAHALGAQPGLGNFVAAVAWRFALVAVPCVVIVAGLLRLARGLWPSALGPLLAMSAVYALLAAQFALQPRAPAVVPVVAGAPVAATPTPIAPSVDPAEEWEGQAPADFGAPPDDVAAAPETAAPATADAVPVQAASPAQARPAYDPDPMNTRAHALYVAGDWQALLAHATAWTDAEPDRQYAWMYLGLANERLGRRQDALAANLRAHRIDPDDMQIASNLANSHLALGQFREAADLLETVVARNPRSHRALNDYGYAMSSLGEYDEAVAALQRAVEIEPGYTLAWQNLANAYQRAGNLDKAREVAERANARR